MQAAVSPTYAEEITTPEFAYGFARLAFWLKSSRSFGGDFKWCGRKYLASERGSIHSAPLQAQIYGRQKKNKAELQAYFNLPQDESALAFVMVTRLTEQKVLIY